MSNPPTIDDVAGAVGLSRSTVSKALSGTGTLSTMTRARVRTVARELGYEPNPLAQNLATGFRNQMVYMFSGALDVGLAMHKVRLIQKVLNENALEVPIHTCPELATGGGHSQIVQINKLCRQRPRAIICAVQMIDPGVFLELAAYQRSGGIVVSYDTLAPIACDQVIFDREDNAYQAARHLLDKGHRRIGIGISRLPKNPIPNGTPSPQSLRLKGFRRALAEFGVPFRDEWLFENGDYEDGGAEMARRFLAMSDRPTGLCIVNDYVAFAFMVDITRAGVRVPEHVSIVSHDNQSITPRCPVPMSSATQPAEEIANAVASMLMERLDGFTGEPRRRVIRGLFTERDSVGPPPRA